MMAASLRRLVINWTRSPETNPDAHLILAGTSPRKRSEPSFTVMRIAEQTFT